MSSSLIELLRDSQRAATTGDTLASWRLISRYAQEFWLADDSAVPDELRGELFPLRATAADWLGLVDEAVCALRDMRHWAHETNLHEASLLADAHLAYHSLNSSEELFVTLAPAPDALASLADGFAHWRPHPDSPTIGESAGMTWKDVSARQASTLATAAVTAHTVASNLIGEDTAVDVRGLVEYFATMVRRFGRKAANPADEVLWYAQEHWVHGRYAPAKQLVEGLLDGDVPRSAVYEAHYILGQFAAHYLMDESTQRACPDLYSPDSQSSTLPSGVDEAERSILRHWGYCAELSVALGAPVMGLDRAELACRLYLARGNSDAAWSLASRMVERVKGVPVCPAVLNLQAVLAETALSAGDDQRAWELANTVADWSEMTAEHDRTATCLTVATLAGINLELDEEVFDLQHRRIALARSTGDLTHASHLLQSLAVGSDLAREQRRELMRQAWECLTDLEHIDNVWDEADWHLTMCHIAESEPEIRHHAHTAIESFSALGDSMKQAEGWLLIAHSYVLDGAGDAADTALLTAQSIFPELDAWLDDDGAELDPVASELLAHYRLLRGLRGMD